MRGVRHLTGERPGVSVYDYVGLKDHIASLFDGAVDVANREGLKPWVSPAASADAIYAF